MGILEILQRQRALGNDVGGGAMSMPLAGNINPRNPFLDWLDQNKGKITNAFGGMVGAGNDPRMAAVGWSQGLAHGQSVDEENAILAQQEAEKKAALEQTQQEQNQTRAWIMKNAPQYADLPIAEGLKLATAQLGAGSDAPANIQEWQAYSRMTGPQKAEYLRMKRANPYLDVGTGYVQPDPVNPGQTTGPAITKDNYTPAYDAASGAATGKVDVENQAAADSLASKMPGLKAVVGELSGLADKATYTQTGQLWDTIARETGAMPSEGAIARTKYMAMVDNQVLPLLRDTFGAAFTVQEGASLRATLGAPDKSPSEKQVVLEAFIEQKVRDLEAMQSRLPSAGKVDYNSKYGLE